MPLVGAGVAAGRGGMGRPEEVPAQQPPLACLSTAPLLTCSTVLARRAPAGGFARVGMYVRLNPACAGTVTNHPFCRTRWCGPRLPDRIHGDSTGVALGCESAVSGVLDPERIMTKILHLIDESTQEDALMTLAQLLSRVALPDSTHAVGAFGAVSVSESIARHARVVRLGDRMGWPFWRAMPLRQVIDGLGVSLVHAWSAVAAGCAQLVAGETCPVLVTACEPPMPRRWGRWVAAAERFRSLRPPTMVFPSQQFRRRALAAGIATEFCGVIQPAVDFAAINEAQRSTTRASLGIRTDGPILLTVMPPTRSGGQYCAVWAAAVLQQLWPDIRVIVPGESAEARRLVRFATSFQMPDLVIATRRRVAFERLLAVADVLVVPALDDAPVGGVAWAMAACVPIVGSAVPAVTEYLADGHNALLCKPGDPMLLAQRIRTALRDREMVASLCETARGEAFDSFSLTRLAKEYRTLYTNLLAGRPPFAGLDGVALTALEALRPASESSHGISTAMRATRGF